MREEREIFESIGRFVFWFSKLEGMLKADLAGLLDLDNDYLARRAIAWRIAPLYKIGGLRLANPPYALPAHRRGRR
jgi:hypothetical protein